MFYRNHFLTNITAVSLSELIDLGVCERDLEEFCIEFDDFSSEFFPGRWPRRQGQPTI